MGVPLLIHQPSYSMLNRWIEQGLLDTLDDPGDGMHCVLAAGAGPSHQQVSQRRTRAETRATSGQLVTARQLPERREYFTECAVAE